MVRNFTESHSHIISYIAGETLLTSIGVKTNEWGMTVAQEGQVCSKSDKIIEYEFSILQKHSQNDKKNEITLNVYKIWAT